VASQTRHRARRATVQILTAIVDLIWLSNVFSNSYSAAAKACETASRRRGTGCTVIGTICPLKRCLKDLANFEIFKTPTAKLSPGEASRLRRALDVAAMPIQSVHGIKAASEAAVWGGNIDDE
jgi:hypothetical protein